jgi:amino acid transporter
MRPTPHLVRAIGRWSLTALVINSIIGSGIFGLPSDVARLLGPVSPVAFLIAALGMGSIIACFAEVASRYADAGGPYLYARDALGRFLGLQVGWLAWLVRTTAAGANANLFVNYLGEFWPPAANAFPRFLVLTLLIGFLAVVNYRGVRAGIRLSNMFTLAKLIPLVLFIIFGLLLTYDRPPTFDASPAPAMQDWLRALLLLVFAYGGFEAALIPMGEAKNPHRDAPVALFAGLAVVAILYTLIQLVVVSVLSPTDQTPRPLALAARQFLGSIGAIGISMGAMISVYGYLSSMMLNTPRLPFALAERGDFPSMLAVVHPRFHTPYRAIVISAVMIWIVAVAGTFSWNVSLSAIARLLTYGTTCAALIIFRRTDPDKTRFRLPGGQVIALAGLAFSLVVITQMGWTEFRILGLTMLLAFANWVWVQNQRPRPQT